ncbi:hypothetical protein GCM10027569_70890 [Flindersiella endophytica]
MPGWIRPDAHAVGVDDGQGTRFPMVNVGTHPLPAVILAEVCGHRRSGNWTYVLTVAELEQAIQRLTPAEAWPGSDHPNLLAWRQIVREVQARPLDDLTIVAVFLGHLDQPARDEHQLDLLKAINSGQD